MGKQKMEATESVASVKNGGLSVTERLQGAAAMRTDGHPMRLLLEDALAEVEWLQSQRDYYRRRWLIHGMRFPSWLFRREAYVAAAMERLGAARKRDGDLDTDGSAVSEEKS